MQNKYEMSKMKELAYFLGLQVKVKQVKYDIFINQIKYNYHLLT